MISKNEALAFYKKVSALTKSPGKKGSSAIRSLMEQNRQIARDLNKRLLLVLVDEVYLGGKSMRRVAEEQGVSVNAVSLWFKEAAPAKYVSVSNRDGEFVLEEVDRLRVKDVIGQGRRVAPAVMRLYDDESGIVFTGNPADLWHQLASQSAGE